MGSTPEQLLARTKARSAQLRKRRLAGTGGGLAALTTVIALLAGIVPAAVPGALSPPVSGGTHRPGQVYVAARIGDADELLANVSPGQVTPGLGEKAVAGGEAGFSLSLLDAMAGDSASSNTLVSPSSLATALAMLQLGARGATAQSIARVLGTAGLSSAEQAAGWRTLSAVLESETSRSAASLGREPELNIANALWLQRGFPVNEPFVRAETEEFGAGVWQADFAGDLSGAVAAINAWTSQHTNGLIKQLFSPGSLDASTVAVLADAVYFDAKWNQALVGPVKPASFTLADGRTETVPTMHSAPPNSTSPKYIHNELDVPSSVTSSYEGIELPYKGKKMSAVVLMPRSRTLPAFVQSLTPGRLTSMIHAMRQNQVSLSMPEFSLTSDNQLVGTLGRLGMGPALSGSANYSGLSSQGGVGVGTIEQHAVLKVSPLGTQAAAATGISIATALRAVAPPVVIDHPFLFLVRDDATGTILFEAMVENPKA